MTDLQERIEAVQEACDLAYADVIFAQCALRNKDDMITEQTESESQDPVVQEMTVIAFAVTLVLVGQVSAFCSKLLTEAYIFSSFEKRTVKRIAELAEIAKDANGEIDPKKALENFKKMKKIIRDLEYLTGRVGRNPYNYKAAHKKYYAEEIKEIAKLSDIAENILDESKITKKRAKKSGNTDVFTTQLDGLFEQAKKVLEIIERAAKKRKSKSDLPPEDGGADVNEAPETVEAETEPTENTEESED